ncbi:REQUIRED FOR SNC4-1D 2, DNA-DAMAGE-REPAIR/TOLERATION PROTEIN 111 [Hibiscus trionum]|uniref:REQUIRED FOR SNC4-1D 2, DNA-DAMAGE-REPAIR/TOLERATION PROTEIN 111 n=1 Tax=Hibiscus trionum TaxID=183268 RepID=A0A9W7H6P1_HIBTR|nr:REQUIRED FOR SNC4-1D 2, DNA-DAMAGE-REPAIR/TOLERATION PROTEIN 111 [Hibiscus trionum]
MLGGLYGDLLPPSDEDNQPSSNTTVWSSSAKMAPPTLRKPFSGIAPPQTVLRSQNKPKNSVPKTIVSSVPASISPSPAAVSTEGMAQLQPALMGVTSSVIEELNISGEEAWRRRAAMSGGVPRSPISSAEKS